MGRVSLGLPAASRLACMGKSENDRRRSASAVEVPVGGEKQSLSSVAVNLTQNMLPAACGRTCMDMRADMCADMCMDMRVVCVQAGERSLSVAVDRPAARG